MIPKERVERKSICKLLKKMIKTKRNIQDKRKIKMSIFLKKIEEENSLHLLYLCKMEIN